MKGIVQNTKYNPGIIGIRDWKKANREEISANENRVKESTEHTNPCLEAAGTPQGCPGLRNGVEESWPLQADTASALSVTPAQSSPKPVPLGG